MGIKRELSNKKFNHPIILTGCMRSGTTFLANLLGEHPNLLHLEGELIDTWSEIGGIDCKKNRRYADRNDIKTSSIISMTAYFEQCLTEFSKPKYGLWRLINKIKKGSGGVRKNWSSIQLLNKNVHLINRIDYVQNMFPESKVILLVRSMESQVNSLKLHFEKMEIEGKTTEAPNNQKDSWITNRDIKVKRNWNVESLAKKWIDLNFYAIDDLLRNGKDRFIVVNYESLVSNPQKELNKIYDKLGMDHLQVEIKNTLTDRKSFNTNTKGDPLNDWKTRLTENEISTINNVKKANQKEMSVISSYTKA